MKGVLPRERESLRARRHRSDGYCNEAGKLRYRTRRKAIKAPRPDGIPQEPYECRFCGDWHLFTPEKAA